VGLEVLIMNLKQNLFAAAALAMAAFPAYAQTGSSSSTGSSTTGNPSYQSGSTSPSATTPSQSATTPSTTQPGSKDSMADKGGDHRGKILGFIHRANKSEIEMAKLAKDNGSSDQVKKFADTMIKDHQNADDQVLAFAKAHNVDLEAMHAHGPGASAERATPGSSGTATPGSPGTAGSPGTKMDENNSRAVGSATGEYAQTATGGSGTAGDAHAQAKAEQKATLEKLRGLKGPEFDREYIRAMVKDHQMVIDRLTSARSQISDPEYVSLVDKLMPTLKQHLTMAQKIQDNLAKSS
jgi:predicted outer membrane protein